MGLFSSVKKRFVIQLIAVVLEEKQCKIYVKKIKNLKEIHIERKSFDIDSKEQLTPQIINYLNSLQDMHEQTYVALFLNTLGQGAISGCNTGAYEKFGVDKKSVKSICVDNRFTIYASLIDINWVDKIFKNVGLDFIFSPFLVLNSFIKKDSDTLTKDEIRLYILNTNNGLTIMIKQRAKLLYGSFFNLAKEENLLYEDFESGDSSDVDNLEEELFDEFDIDEDNQEVAEMQEFDDSIVFDDEDMQSGLSQKDMRFVKYLDASLKEFYNSDLYESSFISSVKIYDDAGINEDVIRYIEDELFLDISTENINILEAVCEIAEEEVISHA
jgi:hypothetical protein